MRLNGVLVCWVTAWLAATGLARAEDSLPLQDLGRCRLQEATWLDGDSFPVILPDGRTVTIRLYGVDCFETNVQGDDSNARRLRDQRRWFGIADIEVAQDYGEAAKQLVAELLAEPFMIHTAFADGRGDPQFKRYYGFVTLSDGRDLSEVLVQLGLARAFGVSRSRPDGSSAEEWKARLADLELQASKRGVGAWAETDWERLPQERSDLRKEEAELALVMGASKVQDGETVDVNTAARDELMRLPGIGEVTAVAIIEGRPFLRVEDLRRVRGIGAATLEKLRPHVRVDQEQSSASPP